MKHVLRFLEKPLDYVYRSLKCLYFLLKCERGFGNELSVSFRYFFEKVHRNHLNLMSHICENRTLLGTFCRNIVVAGAFHSGRIS